MVRAGLSDAERRAWRRALGAVFVLIVGGSAAGLAVRGDGSAPEVAAVFLAGSLFGGVLLWYLSTLERPGSDRSRR